jgi:hypothetical protein
MTLEMIPLTPSDLQRPKRISSLVDCKFKLFLSCINDILPLNSESISALSDDEFSLVDEEIWLLYLTLKVKKDYFESLDLPEYHDDYVQLRKIVKKMIIVKRFMTEIEREKYFRLFKRYDLLSGKYTNREELKFFMSSIKSEVNILFNKQKSEKIFSEMCEYMLDNYGDEALNKMTTSVIFDKFECGVD